MTTINRRSFLATSVAASGSLLLAREVFAAYGGFRMGSQSYSFRNFSFEDSIAELKKIGLSEMEFCGVHFPVDAADPGFAKVKETIAAAGITVPSYGVESFTADEAANRKKFEFGKALGLDILTADPTADAFDNLDKLVEEFGIAIAIHNHGPNARYDKVEDTLKAVEGRHPRIGACLDTGHCIRSGEKPHETAEKLGNHLISMHLKDWIHGGEEKIVGEGDLDLAALAKNLRAIKFDGPIMLEYEESPDNPGPDMAHGLELWDEAVSKKKRA